MAQLRVEHVGKEFPTRAESLVVLRDVSFDLEAGRNLAIVGPSGSGKSTLLHIVGGLDPPSSGTVSIDGKDPYRLDETDLARFRNDNVGFVFQDHHLLPQLSVLENVLVPVMAHGPVDDDSTERARELLDRVDLGNRLEHRPSELSGGERERVAVARSLIRRPVLLLADEPTGNLDRTNARRVTELLLGLQQSEGTMLIVVTHSGELAAKMQVRRRLEDGRLVDDA